MAPRLDSTSDTDASTSNDTDTDTETTQCPECSGDLTPDGDETICEECGLVVADHRIDHGPEWRALDGLAGATVYAVCRCNQLPRTRSDVLALVRAPDDQFGHAYDALNQELGLPTPPPEPTAFVARLASDLDVPDRTQKRARNLTQGATPDSPAGPTPLASLAGVSIRPGRTPARISPKQSSPMPQT